MAARPVGRQGRKGRIMDRRAFLAGLSAAALGPTFARGAEQQTRKITFEELIAPRVMRIRGPVRGGEIHVIPDHYVLIWTLSPEQGIRYFVGVGRDGLYESGTFVVGAKKEWPSWTPTPEMIERNPREYGPWKDGMPGGPNNPLGARALYLFYPGRGDSFLRIHGTNLPRTIGHDVSNGCARLVNPHIIDLYNRVPIGTKVVLHPKGILPKLKIGQQMPA